MALEDIDIFDRFLQTKQLQQDQRQQVADTIAPTPAQATYIASFLAPGSSIPDVSGNYPSFPSSEVDLIDAFSGDPMPSLSTNLREGNYFDASMQGLGMAGDALYATPFVGPLLGAGLGTPMKVVSGVGRGISSLNKVQKAKPKDMMFLHNTSEEKIKRFDALGGIPSPSLGVTKANQPLQGFGDIQLIGKPEKFDPAIDPSNKVYSSDAYTPRAPQMIRFAKQDADKQFTKDYKEFTSDSVDTAIESLQNSKKDSSFNLANRNDEFDRFFNSDSARMKFLKEIGRDPMTPRSEPFPQTKYNKWVTEQKNKYLDQEGVFEFTDFFGDTQTMPYTLDNVVSHMVADTQRGGEAGLGSIGPNRLRAFMSKSFSDLPDIKSSKGSIGKSPPFSDVESDVVELLRKQAIDDKVKGQPEFTSIEDVSDMGYEGELLFEKVGENLQAGDKIEDAVAFAYQDVYKVTRNDAFGGLMPSNNKNLKEIVEIFKKNAERPVEYFEAKPTRAVAFDEFAGAIVPPNTSKEVIDILKNRGLKVVKQTKKDYEKFDGKVNARQKFPKEMFALAPVGVASLMQEDLDGR